MGSGGVFVVEVGRTLPFALLFSASGDREGASERSDLRLTVNGTEWTHPHTLHSVLRAGAALSYSHWNNELYFSPPAGAANDRSLLIELDYSVHLRGTILLALLFGASALVLLSAGLGIPSFVRSLGWIANGWMTLLRASSWIAVAGAFAYGVTIIYGLANDDALPPATVFALLPAAHRLSVAEPFVPWLLLVVAGIGALSGWAAKLGILRPGELQADEQRLIRFWSYAGFPVTALMFLFAMSGGGWSGHFASTDMNYMSVGGLVPNSDAKAYYSSAFSLAFWGHWDWVSSQRPFAAALRNFTVLAGGLSYVGTLVVQAVVVAAAMVFAVRSAAAWYGAWVGLALFALLYGIVHPYLLTTMTEPLGLIWSFVSLAFFIEALRTQSVAQACLGFGALVCGLMTRMGSMFTIPFLMLWIPFAFARLPASKGKIFAVLLATALVALGYGTLLGHLYAEPGGAVGGDFAYVACGLAHGSDWLECDRKFGTALSSLSTRNELSMFLYHEAFRAFRAEPALLFTKILTNMSDYVLDLPHLLIQQYITIGTQYYWEYHIILLSSIPGLIYLLPRRENRRLASFFLIIFVSTTLSAGIVFANDGKRVLSVTYPFMALLLALGFSTPATWRRTNERPMLSERAGRNGIAAALVLLLAAPPIAGAAIRTATGFQGTASADRQDLFVVTGRPLMTGFLVLPDGAELPRDVPAMSNAAFLRFYKDSFGRDVDPKIQLPGTPFAAVFSLAESGYDRGYRFDFLAPPEILISKAPHRWRLHVNAQASPPNGIPFLVVDRVEPIP